MSGSGEKGAHLLSQLSSDRMRENSLKLQQGQFRLDIRKVLFSEWVVYYWNRLLREVVENTCLSIFKRHLDNDYNVLTLGQP